MHLVLFGMHNMITSYLACGPQRLCHHCGELGSVAVVRVRRHFVCLCCVKDKELPMPAGVSVALSVCLSVLTHVCASAFLPAVPETRLPMYGCQVGNECRILDVEYDQVYPVGFSDVRHGKRGK
jgi:hypothetical protein